MQVFIVLRIVIGKLCGKISCDSGGIGTNSGHCIVWPFRRPLDIQGRILSTHAPKVPWGLSMSNSQTVKQQRCRIQWMWAKRDPGFGWTLLLYSCASLFNRKYGPFRLGSPATIITIYVQHYPLNPDPCVLNIHVVLRAGALSLRLCSAASKIWASE